MKNKLLLLLFLLPLLASPLFSLSINIRTFDHEDFTRIVFEGDRGFEYKLEDSNEELKIKLKDRARVRNDIEKFTDSRLIDRVVHKLEKRNSVFNVYLKSGYRIDRHFVLERPFRVVFDLVKSPGKKLAGESARSSNADPPQERRFDQKESKKSEIETICLDPGHGGNDLGAIGSSQITEREITLKIAQKLKRIIEVKLGLRVIMTREDDTEVSLDNRVALANNQKAQIFVSIHVNGSFRKSARGPETYFVSLKATDEESFRLAQKENQAFGEIDKIVEDDELKMILWNLAQTEYIKESSKLAEFIQNELNILLNTINRGVKQAPFRVLMRALMPAVLIEIAFLSNPAEEKKLLDNGFLDDAAYAIYTGISKFIYFQNSMYNNKQ